MTCVLKILLFLTALLLTPPAFAQTQYDPLTEKSAFAVEEMRLSYKNGKDAIPLLVYMPEGNGPFPVIMFSHVLGGSRYHSSYLGKQWAARNYIAIFLQHQGSDDSHFESATLKQRMIAMDRAFRPRNLVPRTLEVKDLLNAMPLWNIDPKHPFYQKLNLDRIGMSGHAFGAAVAQAVSGQQSRGGRTMADQRIKAAVILSPAIPRRDIRIPAAFSKVFIPWLIMTGTEDNAPAGHIAIEDRLKIFPALPQGDKYELIFKDGHHFTFLDKDLGFSDIPEIDPQHHQVILALSTAFWDAYLMDNSAAKAWLQSDEATSILNKDDKWRMK